MDDYPFSQKFQSDKEKIVEFLKRQANIEWGGYKLFDGSYTHLQQNPIELTDFIFALKEHEQKTKHPIKKFLEIGFGSGITNTILNKIFNFDEIVTIDSFQSEINNDFLHANLRFKNLIIICGDSTIRKIINKAKQMGPYDLIFIDGNHSYGNVKQDFENYKDMITDKGVIALHDICSVEHPGVPKFWNEILQQKIYCEHTFFCEDFPFKAGIGMLVKPLF